MGLNLFGHDEGLSVSPAQQAIRFLVADNLLGFRVKAQSPTEAVGCVRQVNQRAGDVSFLDRRVEIFFLAASDTFDEVGVMIATRVSAGPGLLTLTEPSPVRGGILVPDCEVAFRPVKDISDCVVATRFRSQS